MVRLCWIKLPVPGRPTVWMIVGQGLIALPVGAGGGSLNILTLLYPFSPLSPSLWEAARYGLKYCLKGPLNQKQPSNQPQLYIMLLYAIPFLVSFHLLLTQITGLSKHKNILRDINSLI